MSLNYRLVWSFVFALALSAASMFYAQPEVSYGTNACANVGAVHPAFYTDCNTHITPRGWPLTILNLSSQVQSGRQVYNPSVQPLGLATDLVLYFGLGFSSLTIAARLRRSKRSTKAGK